MREIRDILFASDFSAESDRAFEHARFLADRFRASLTLYHVVEAPSRALLRVMAATGGQIVDRAEEDSRRCLERRAEGLTVPFRVVVERESAPGLVDQALVQLIRRTRPDLTIMAVRGRKGLSRFFLGSVTEQVVHHAGRPVLCVRKARSGRSLPYRRILVPTDLSAASRRAFSLAGLMARTLAAKVVALHVCPPSTRAALVRVPGPAPADAPTEEQVRRFVQPELEGVKVTAQVYVTGAPWDRIVKVAEEERSDLVVMATQGHDSVRDGIIGSNTERVLRHAPCPVLVA
jgi:nucleotide-binding universal stress UspA family protein